LRSRELFYQLAEGLIIQVLQNIDELSFSMLTRGKPRSIPDTQRSNVCVAVLPRDPTVLVAMASIDSLTHSFPPQVSVFSLLNCKNSQLKAATARGSFIVESKFVA
jgi:hypothetical protein